MSRQKLTAIVPVRKGSQRIKNKNFKPFAGKNLLRIKLEILKKIDIIDSIVVNSDSEEALAMADEFGVEQFRREGYYASSECNNSDFFQILQKIPTRILLCIVHALHHLYWKKLIMTS